MRARYHGPATLATPRATLCLQGGLAPAARCATAPPPPSAGSLRSRSSARLSSLENHAIVEAELLGAEQVRFRIQKHEECLMTRERSELVAGEKLHTKHTG